MPDNSTKVLERTTSKLHQMGEMVGSRLELVSTNILQSRSPIPTKHRIKGGWANYYFIQTYSLMAITFALAFLYFLDYSCTTSVITMNPSNTQNTLIQDLVNKYYVRFCGSEQMMFINLTAANLCGSTYDTQIVSTYCRSYPYNTNDCPGLKLGSNNGGFVYDYDCGYSYNCTDLSSGQFILFAEVMSMTYYYSVCTTLGTAFANTISYVCYSMILSAIVYYLLRFISKNGVKKIFNYELWKVTFLFVNEELEENIIRSVVSKMLLEDKMMRENVDI